jgi:hypothetical protein
MKRPIAAPVKDAATHASATSERDRRDFMFCIRYKLNGPCATPTLNAKCTWAAGDNQEFWNRCAIINPNWHQEEPDVIQFDGYLQGCMWNSWKVFDDALEDGITVYQGYALGGGQWSDHCWCMLGDRIIETTGQFTIYFGAALNEQELADFCSLCADHEPVPATYGHFWTSFYPFGRIHPEIDETDPCFTPSIGRERNSKTHAIKEGLGRTELSEAGNPDGAE